MERRVVFFDVAGTLVRVRGSVGEHYAAVARRFGVEAPPTALTAQFPAAFRAASPMAFPGADPEEIPRLERRVWHDLVRDVFSRAGVLDRFEVGAFDAYFEAVYRHFQSAEIWEVYPDVWPLLEAVRRRGLGTGVITNFDGRVVGILAGLGLARWLDSVTLSSRVGAVKPDSAIFRHALTAHGVGPAEAIHVGDSPDADVRGALAAGLGAVLVDRDGRHAGAPEELRVASLEEVVRFL